MRSSHLRPALKTAALALTILLLSAGVSFAQSIVNLTATRQTTTLPDGNTVPMWGWVCGTGTTATTGATCTGMNGQPQTTVTVGTTTTTPWQPPLIIIPAGVGATPSASVTINLSNSLPVATSVTIVGQLGGGLGSPVRESGPRTDGAHAGQTATSWTTILPGTFTPPAQGARARSFAPEAVATTGSQSYTWPSLRPGTYLIESGTYPSIQGPMGLYGVLVVTAATTTPAPGTAGPGTAYSGSTSVGSYTIPYDADVPLLLSEVDPVQNAAADAAVLTATFSETAVWTPQCGQAHTCYPAAVNFTPLYYMINGVSFDRTAVTSSAVQVPASYSTGNVLLRFVNAGLRMHVPAVAGLSMSLIAEDGNVLPDVALAASHTPPNPLTVRVQSNVFLPAGKVYDVLVSPATNANPTAAPPVPPTAYNAGSYQVFDRELSLSAYGSRHDSGMQTTLLMGGSTISTSATAAVNPDSYSVVPGVTLAISDPGKGVVANDVNVNGVKVLAAPSLGAVTLRPDGTFIYTPAATWTSASSDQFTYYANNNTTLWTTVHLGASTTLGTRPTANAISFNSTVTTLLRVNAPGVLANDTDPNNYPLSAAFASGGTLNGDGSSTATIGGTVTVTLFPDGSLTAVRTCSPCSAAVITFPHMAVNSEKVSSPAPGGTVTLNFNAPSGLLVTVRDANSKAPITDYKWIIEQDLTFNVNPACQQNGAGGSKPASCPAGLVPTLGTNFHSSYMPVIAAGCTGVQSCERGQTVYDPVSKTHVPAVCEGSGICVPGAPGSTPNLPISTPAQVSLTATNPDGTPARYYISVLPGDSANAFNTANGSAPVYPPDPTNCFNDSNATPQGQMVPSCGHTMSGAPIPAPVVVGGAPTFAPVTVNAEPNPITPATLTIYVFEDDYPLNGEHDAGGGIDILATNEPPLGDFQVVLWDDAGSTADATGQMTYDMFNQPLTNSLNGMVDPHTGLDACPISNAQSLPQGSNAVVGVIIVCPRYESDGVTLSPLTGEAVIKGLMPGRFGVIVHPGAAREANGEEWLQTNTLDGTHFLDSFVRAGEPNYFQEFGPGGWHVFMGMANPAIINQRRNALCTASATTCNNTINVQVSNLHMSRPPNEVLYDSMVFPQGDARNYRPLSYTTCYASLGDPDGATLAFTKCDPNGNLKFTGIPDGDYALVVFDQWLDLIVDGSSKSVSVKGGVPVNIDYSAFSWQQHTWSNTYLDLNGNGIQDLGEPGIGQVPSRIRFRNGKFSNTSFSDLNGMSAFNETFPLFNWYVVESDTTRYKGTGVHVVYDAGGPIDGPAPRGNGNTGPYQGILNSRESFSLPNNLRVPGAVYCGRGDCSDVNLGTTPAGGGPGGSTGRIDPGTVVTEGVQGFLSQINIIDWGKKLYAVGENGGIRGHVAYASTRPFDDPNQVFQNLWAPLVPRVTVNLYQEGTAPDGTLSLKLVDTTKTSSWDDWAQGFRADLVTPNLNCPGQDPADPFYNYTLLGSRHYLKPGTALPNNGQYKCYDGMHMFNQVQPAPYDGLYQFPSAAYAAAHPLTTLQRTAGQTLVSFPLGKYVVEVVPPPGYEIVKEEDKNILIGDNYIAPVTQQFGGLGNIFIIPDQATMDNANPAFGTGGGAINPTTDLGRSFNNGGFGPGGNIVMPAPCVGALRIVPDYMSISPESGEVAPFAGASRRLCDRKEITLEDQMQGETDFFVWTKVPAASHFAGFILDDFSSEFDVAAPSFGEKFAVPNVPISMRDFNGLEVSRLYSDQWGIYNGLSYSSWEVNPPNPTGYSPNMMITCMNDPGPIPDPLHPGQMITDPMYNPAYSNFCYENPFMPADTAYLDTPVIPVSAFAEGYNPPDCAYPDATPAISLVTGDTTGGGAGPWAAGPNGNRVVASVTLSNGGSGYTSAPTVSISGGGGSGAAVTTTLGVNSVTVSNGGSGYTNSPTVSFSGASGSGAAATATLGVNSVTVSDGGSGYTSAPPVSISGGGGSGAAASTATMGVTSVTVTNGGTGYASAPSVSISGGGGSGAAATARLGVSTITVSNGGGGYTIPPTVSLSGGGGNGAAASATLGVNSVTVSNGGSGYTTAPPVSLSGGGGSGAAATATLTVNTVTVSNGGSGYSTAPTVILSGGGGNGAAATATTGVSLVTVNNGGSGYTSVPTVILSGGGGSGAAATATLRLGSISVSNGGSGYTSNPSVSISGGGGIGAAASVNSLGVSSVNVTNGGSGYTCAPTVFFDGGDPNNATATATVSGGQVTSVTVNTGGQYPAPADLFVSLNGGCGGTGAAVTATLGVTSVTLTNAGSGYTNPPTVSFSGGGGSGAVATANLAVSLVAVSNGGSGYTGAPTVSFSGGGGSGTVAAAFLGVSSITVSNGGSGYTSAPTVSFSGGGGSGATATTTMRVNAISVTVRGLGYTSQPGVTIGAPPTGGTTATATVSSMSVAAVTVTAGGTGYTSNPSVSFSAPPSGVTALGTARIGVSDITVTARGSGYTSAPSVSFSGGGGSGATAITGMGVDAISVNAAGSGYTSQPVVTIGAAPSGGTTATATAFLRVNAVTVTTGGSGYTGVPSVSFDAPPSGVTAVGSARIGVNTITLTSGGMGYTSTPSVIFSNNGGGGSGAAATATIGAPESHTLTITALGDQIVPNHAYSGPAATTAPYNLKFITRHYGFGASRGTGSVTIGGVPISTTGMTWSDTTISFPVPIGLPPCTMQQAAPYNYAACGELLITAGNGKQSIDTVTVTVGGKAPTVVLPGQTIQSAIDAAAPGDLIIVSPGTYNEMLLMWKPVRLQGVGAASVTINANAHPAGKLDAWRQEVNCLFGLALNGGVIDMTINPATMQPKNPYDPSGTLTCSTAMQGQTDRLPMEGMIGWDTSLNGNLAELLQEPSLMGAYEGAGITVLGKAVPGLAPGPQGREGPPETFTIGNPGGSYPVGTVALNDTTDCVPTSANYFVGNFKCAPSRVDGISITNSSQGGGAIFAHAWNHNLEVSNNRVFANRGTMAGGINIGQGEFVDAENGGIDGASLIDANGVIHPYLYNSNVHVHHNSVTMNASEGDELFSSTPAGGGGVTFCTGSDYYKFDYNWVCGNMSTGDGGGVAHVGFTWNGTIEHNSILFNQSFNPTITAHGGGIVVMGAGRDGLIIVPTTGIVTECGSVSDVDCAPSVSDGTGPGLKINANLIIGNTAEAGSGGGLRLQQVNGADVEVNPTNSANWNSVSVTNNIIANNVAGWTGGGVSLQDAVNVSIVNNTIESNDTTASAGVLFDTGGAPLASIPPQGCDPAKPNNLTPGTNYNNCTNSAITTSTNQPSGLATAKHTVLLTAALAPINPNVCPAGHPNCKSFSNPVLANNIIWQNRAFHITTGANPIPGAQTVVTLAPLMSQTATGGCPAGASYWDIGVYGDIGPGNHASGFTLAPRSSVLDDAYPGQGNRFTTPGVVKQACNGSRVPPEIAPAVCTSTANAPGCAQNGNPQGGMTVPTGVPDINPFYPVFNLNPAATTDEGNNFINMFYGPLSMTNSSALSGSAGFGVPISNYALAQNSTVINAIPRGGATFGLAPSLDFYGRPRPDAANLNAIDIGAVEFTNAPNFVAQPTSLTFASALGATTAAQSVTVNNTGNTTLSLSSGISIPNAAGQWTQTNTCASVAPGASCTISVTFHPTGSSTPTPRVGTLIVNIGNGSPQSVALTGNIVPPVVSLSPTPVPFGSQTRTTTSAPQTLTLSNNVGGTVALTGITITIAPTGQFAQPAGAAGGTCGTSLAVGATCTINVTFTPTAAATGAQSATLSVNGIGLTPAVTATLTGTALAASTSATLAPARNFVGQNVGTTSTSQTVTLTNASGGGSLLNISVGITGTNAGDFAQTNTCGPSGSSLAAGANCTINVTFGPTTTGGRSATLSVTSSAPLLTVALTGTGTQAAVSFSGPTPALTTGGPSNTALRNGNITISNTSTGTTAGPLTYTGATVGRLTGTGTFTITAGTTGTSCTVNPVVQPGSSCTINVHYVPPSAPAPAASTARVTVTDTGAATTSQTYPAPPATAFSAN